MKLSESNSYLLAVIIVILGTLIIAAGFTLGLISLTKPDNVIIDTVEEPEEKLTNDTQVERRDSIFTGKYPSETEIPGEIELWEYLIPSYDILTITPKDKKMAILDSADKNVKKDKWIFIDKSNFTLTLYNEEVELREWKVAVGNAPGDKQRVGDNRTPNGSFKIRQIQDSSKWTYDFKDGNGPVEGAYGPWFIRLYTPPWTGIGIHGTHNPNSISSRASEGCIRMKNEDVAELKKIIKVGMPVIIVE